MSKAKARGDASFDNLANAVDYLTSSFEAAGLADAREEARTLVCIAAGLSKLDLLMAPAHPLGPEIAAKAENYMERRLAREPVSRIIGRRDFWNVSLEVRSGVLDPRADTERLVEVSLSKVSLGRSLKILDVGVGSGAILCALLAELPDATGVGLDISEAACEAARENLLRLDLNGRSRVVHSDCSLFDESGFDLVVANPPYIRSVDIARLDPEVARYDPIVALDGGKDGLEAYRAIAKKLPSWLSPGGSFVLEIGFDQGIDVQNLLREAGFQNLRLTQDYNGLDRVVSGLTVAA